MKTKLFEVRDEGTNISVMAIKLGGETNLAENGILAHAGYGVSPQKRLDSNYVILVKLNGSNIEVNHDPFKWPGSRTMCYAHTYIQRNFDELTSGDVIDIQYLGGETKTPKTSDNLVYSRYMEVE